MSIAEVFKGIIDKFNKSPKPELPEWTAHYDKIPVRTETVSARVTVNSDSFRLLPEGYVNRRMAELIARELVEKELFAIEQLDDRPGYKMYSGKIEIVSRG